MRLEFRVLWFENQPQDVRTQIAEIEDHVRDVGFIPRIEMVPDASNLPALSKQQQLYDDYDLVVVDYDLGNPGANGDHVAKQVRKGFGFTDIIFYSGHKTVDLRKLVHDNHIDGVYCLERPRLAERLGVHIDQAVKRLSRLEAMRGLAMGTVGKCDDELRVLLTEAYARSAPTVQQKITADLDSLVANGAKVSGERYEACSTFDERLASRAVTSFHLYKLSLAVLKGNPSSEAERKVLVRYNEEVLDRRNTLGHATEIRGKNGWEASSHGKPAITSADFPKLRQDLALHLDNICAIRPLLFGEGLK